MTARLLEPLKLRGIELPNRIVVSPMCQYSAADGCATDWHLVHLGQFALSGAGLVIVEATHVERRGRITHACLGLYSDDNEASLARIVAFFRRHGTAKLGIQLSRAENVRQDEFHRIVDWTTGATEHLTTVYGTPA